MEVEFVGAKGKKRQDYDLLAKKNACHVPCRGEVTAQLWPSSECKHPLQRAPEGSQAASFFRSLRYFCVDSSRMDDDKRC
jgi:hypothetical protein